MRRELSFHNNVRFIYTDATANSEKQVTQIDSLLGQHIDLLVVSPNEVQPLSTIIQKVYDKGIPVVLIDRKTNSDKYTAFIGAENFEVGQNAGRYAASILKGKGRVMEVTAQPDASPFIGRHNGFIDIISKYPGIQFLEKVDGRDKKKLDEYMRSAGGVDLVFVHNDMMANDVYQSCKRIGIDKKVKIIGVDGLPVKGMGLDMVANREITATVLYPTGGEEAILTALNILENKPFHKENQLFTTVIDSTNVRLMKMQAEKLISQQKDIEERQKILDRQIIISHNQSTVIIIIALTLSLTLIFGGLSYYFLKENRKITSRLEVQNREISTQKNQLEQQKNQLIEVSAKAEEAHQAKLNFFTNISHEFRTPLTLILSPLDELINNSKVHVSARQTLQLVEKNVLRLYRLVNQLMDFRKIEFKKMHVNASENDLVVFIKDIVSSYESLAKNKNISLHFLTAERKLPAWFDITMIDKVIFNLLSNAFKFTGENGYVHVSLLRYEADAVIKIEDSGVGMSKEAVQHVFEPFFQGEFENYKGTGLGLALSKELVELHNGSITVKSEKGKGTEFEIRLPLAAQSSPQHEMPAYTNSIIKEDAKIYTTELYEKLAFVPEEPDKLQKKHTILIIEDNADLRQYLKKRLSASYDVVDATDASVALQATFETVPDIIVCDVVMPGKSGLDLTKVLKSDIRTAHIPIILLTARSEEVQKIEGFKTGADAYITKPFNFTLLAQQINSLLLNRDKSKEHYSGEPIPGAISMTAKKSDRKFISDFIAIVEKNISNDAFSIEQICTEMNISHVQLSRKIKALLECNINDYIINTRLQKAKYYLQHESLSISEVAFKTGFSSATYFSTVFKNKLSMTPSEFKESVN